MSKDFIELEKSIKDKIDNIKHNAEAIRLLSTLSRCSGYLEGKLLYKNINANPKISFLKNEEVKLLLEILNYYKNLFVQDLSSYYFDAYPNERVICPTKIEQVFVSAMSNESKTVLDNLNIKLTSWNSNLKIQDFSPKEIDFIQSALKSYNVNILNKSQPLKKATFENLLYFF